jgi:prepilin signal peptidase PulO-like enzyme (type II secretory pathway)
LDDGAVQRIHYRFGIVLALLVVAVFFVMAAPHGDGARFVSVTLQATVLVAAVIASKAHRWVIRLSVAAAIVGIAGSAAALFGTGQFGNSTAGIVALLYVLMTPPAIATGVVRQFREEGGVTIHSMFGVLCLYLLIGLIFAVAFAVIQDVSSTDFFTTKDAGRDDFLYFSYATLTTVGYGDLIAATNLGRSLAISEALLGQIYLVTVVAVIVGNLRGGRARVETDR